MKTSCQHRNLTHVTTDGLGSWNVTETYKCDDCGHLVQHQVDTSYSPDEDDHEVDGVWS